MQLARVTGKLEYSKDLREVRKLKMVVAYPIDLLTQEKIGDMFVTVNAAGANIGDIVVCADGSSARKHETTINKPVNSIIIAVVEGAALEDKKLVFEQKRTDEYEQYNDGADEFLEYEKELQRKADEIRERKKQVEDA